MVSFCVYQKKEMFLLFHVLPHRNTGSDNEPNRRFLQSLEPLVALASNDLRPGVLEMDRCKSHTHNCPSEAHATRYRLSGQKAVPNTVLE